MLFIIPFVAAYYDTKSENKKCLDKAKILISVTLLEQISEKIEVFKHIHISSNPSVNKFTALLALETLILVFLIEIEVGLIVPPYYLREFCFHAV